MKMFMKVALVTSLALGASQAHAQQTVKVGALYPFSGGLALLGDESFRGLEIAVEERNTAGGLNGKKIELVRGDAVDPNQAVGEARRLTSVDVSEPVDEAKAGAMSGVTRRKPACRRGMMAGASLSRSSTQIVPCRRGSFSAETIMQ